MVMLGHCAKSPCQASYHTLPTALRTHSSRGQDRKFVCESTCSPSSRREKVPHSRPTAWGASRSRLESLFHVPSTHTHCIHHEEKRRRSHPLLNISLNLFTVAGRRRRRPLVGIYWKPHGLLVSAKDCILLHCASLRLLDQRWRFHVSSIAPPNTLFYYLQSFSQQHRHDLCFLGSSHGIS